MVFPEIAAIFLLSECKWFQSDEAIMISSPTSQSGLSYNTIWLVPSLAVASINDHVCVLTFPWISRIHSWQPINLFPIEGN